MQQHSRTRRAIPSPTTRLGPLIRQAGLAKRTPIELAKQAARKRLSLTALRMAQCGESKR